MRALILEGYKIYPESILKKDGKTYFLASKGIKKYLVSDDTEFEKPVEKVSTYNVYEKTHLNALRLRNLFKHLNPAACGIKRSFGFGDRLGLATLGHIKAIKGRDKFSIYPIIAEATISHKNPALYRRMHQTALNNFEKDRKSYHVTTNLSKIPPLDKLSNEELPELLNENNSRQLMHITYGSILKDMKEDVYNTLNIYENEHYEMLGTHLGKHLDLAGISL